MICDARRREGGWLGRGVVECEVIASFGAPDGIKLDDCLGSSDDRRDREIDSSQSL
jgi:hypothetical protein